MSIASNFRAKWDVLIKASDDTFHSFVPDTRRAAMAKAADDAGLVLIEKTVIDALAKRIKELESEAKREAEKERFDASCRKTIINV